MTKPANSEKDPEFSLVLGGPLFQLYRGAHLSGDALELAHRRVLVLAVVAWLPLLVLSVIGKRAFGGALTVPFLYDIEAHVRFLIALPILIAAEPIVHSRIRPAVKKFLERGIIIPEDIVRFDAAIDSAMRLRNSLMWKLPFWFWFPRLAYGHR
jgi:hypothetical protein